MHKTILRSSVSLAGLALVAACSGDSIPTDPTSASIPAFNVINPTSGSVMLCPQGPDGNYTYTISVQIEDEYTIGGVTSTFPPAVLADAATKQSLPLGANPVLAVPSANFNCYEVFEVTASTNYNDPGTGASLDPVRIVTITQTSAPAGSVLDSVLTTQSDNPSVDVKTFTATVIVNPNFFHGYVISFWNSIPEGMGQRTIGFWSQWSSCSGGGQDPVLDQTLASFGGGSVLIGDLAVSTCQVATRLLKKSDVVTGFNRANDAAYSLAAQLLAAKLNVQAGATTCTAANTAISGAQTLLANIDFTGTGAFLAPGSNATLRNQANGFAATLDSYNNGTLC